MIIERYLELGIEGITLADTTGMANPRQVAHLVRRVLTRVASERLSLHFHNTRGLPTLVGHEGAGQVAKAARPSDLHPAPA